jgi:hypothetical protein
MSVKCRLNVGYRKRIDSDTEHKRLKGINMDKQQAQAIIKNTFESSDGENRWSLLYQ